MHGRVLRRNEKLKSCRVTAGCAIQVTSRMPGGRRHKDEKSKEEEETSHETGASESQGSGKTESEKDAVIRMLEETEEYRNIVAEDETLGE